MKIPNFDSDRIRLHSGIFRPLKAFKGWVMEHRPRSDAVVSRDVTERSPVFWKGSLWKSLQFFEVLPSGGSASFVSLLKPAEIAELPSLKDSLKRFKIDDKAKDFSTSDAKILREALALLGGEFFATANNNGEVKTEYISSKDPELTLTNALRSAFASGMPRRMEAVKVVLELGLIHPDDRDHPEENEKVEKEEFLLEQVLSQPIYPDFTKWWEDTSSEIASAGTSVQSSSLVTASEPLKESAVKNENMPISCKERVEILLKYGANPHNLSRDGKSMWKLAEECDLGKDAAEIIDLMLKSGYPRTEENKFPVEKRAGMLGEMLSCVEHLPVDLRKKWHQALTPNFEKVHAELKKTMATNLMYQFDPMKSEDDLKQTIKIWKKSLSEPVPWLKQWAEAYVELKNKETPFASLLLKILEDASKLYVGAAYKKYIVDNYEWIQEMESPRLFFLELESCINGDSRLRLKDCKVLPDFIGHLPHLTTLSLRDSELKEVPMGVRKLKNLERLYLQDNQLTTIPAWLNELTKLRRIDISYNRLTSLPELSEALSRLETLLAGGNSLNFIPDSICKLTNLRTIVIWGNELSTLPQGIREMDLVFLDAEKNPLTPETIALLQRMKGSLGGSCEILFDGARP